ncbi:MAG: ACP phosphodiesterase [Bacteroidales bacterium]|jgi:acyl carrier protein phosphodiesterase|nr:ACP phosphodiesterase [Bacteroidales bacterium]
MNYLAHTYLSGDNDDIKIGNFLGDWVKGSDYLNYSEDIRTGILLHRNIDSFTDRHPIVHLSAGRFQQRYAKYSGIIIDILYDHFLASNWSAFNEMNLHDYVNRIHNIMLNNLEILPERLQNHLPGFMNERWIERYATIDGIRDVLDTMSKRTSLPNETEFAISVMEAFYDNFRYEFFDFFGQIIEFVETKFMIPIYRPES